MTSEKMNAYKRLVTAFLCFFISVNICAQDGQNERPNVPVGSNCNGYLEYLPTGYTAGTSRYPLLINILGLGSSGNGSLTSLNNLYGLGGGNPHEQANAGSWPDAFTVNSQTFQFVVITPQFLQDVLTHIPTPSEVNEVINYVVQNYRIDTSRIYLVGSSQGAGAVWDYVGSSSQYARRIAAIVPFAGVSFPFQEKANIMKNGKVAVWAFHNQLDNDVPTSFTNDYVNFYNNGPKPFSITARKTIFPNATPAHQCWFGPLRGEYTEGGEDIYHWMLKYQNEASKANAGNDQEIVLPTNSVTLTASGSAPNGTSSTYNWQNYFGPNGGTFSIGSPNAATTSVTGLSQGTYLFKLTITGTNGSTAEDLVAITVNPTQQRIQAEAYSSCIQPIGTFIPGNDSLFNNATQEADGTASPRKIDGINYNNWMEYSVTVPVTGTYRIRFRAGSGTGGNRFKVKNSLGDESIVTLYATGGDYDSYMNVYGNIPITGGSPQTLRIENYPEAGLQSRNWFLNWFEIINLETALYPLPVKFSLFNVNCANNKANVSWRTAGETNSSKFLVERSNDGRNWSVITTVAAAGQSSSERNYNYVDQSAGTNSFYRITQQDIDGKITQTSILKSSCNGEQTFSVFPNPAHDKTVLSINSLQSTKLNVSILDSRGSVVRTQQTNLLQGNSQVTVDINGLANGVYTLQANWNGQTKTTRFIKN